MDKYRDQDTLETWVVGMFTILLGIVVVAIVSLASTFWWQWSGQIENWGQTGDYLGGFLNPVVSTATLIVTVYIALLARQIQRDEQAALSQPYLYLSTINRSDEIEVAIENLGVGAAKDLMVRIQHIDADVPVSQNFVENFAYPQNQRQQILLEGVHSEPPRFLPAERKLTLIRVTRSLNSPPVPLGSFPFQDAIELTRLTLAGLVLRVEYDNIFSQEPIETIWRMGERFGPMIQRP